jgi:SpoIID/LytB domain protein
MNTIKSGMFSFSPIGPKDLEDALENSTSVIENSGTVTVINLNEQRSYSKTLQIIGRDGIIRDVVAGSLAISDGKVTVLPKDEPSTPIDTFTPIINLGTESQLSSPITFYGLGWGHGVGMAQDSIIAMGKLGYDYKYMLNYFFTDIKIEAWNN